MDEKTLHDVIEELFPYFEAAEAQSAAVLQFLKEKGIASEEELAPYIKRAENASSVRWRAARARINYLLQSVIKPPEKVEERKPEPPEAESKKSEPKETKSKEPEAKEPSAKKDSPQGSKPGSMDSKKDQTPQPKNDAAEERPKEKSPAESERS